MYKLGKFYDATFSFLCSHDLSPRIRDRNCLPIKIKKVCTKSEKCHILVLIQNSLEMVEGFD